MYETMEIAKYIITKCSRENEPLSNLQLQKIMYYVQRDFLQNTGYPIFYDDFYAWKFGPVLEDVYYNYCNRGASKIQEEYNIINIEKAAQKRIDNVVIEKRKLNPWVWLKRLINKAEHGNMCIIMGKVWEKRLINN